MIRSALISLALLAGCAAASAEPVVVTDAQDGRSITLGRDQRLVLHLPANASTGYSWAVTEAANLTPVSQNYIWPAGAPGSPGTQEYVFAATGAGSGRLVLVYRRPWEQQAAPARRFTLTVVAG